MLRKRKNITKKRHEVVVMLTALEQQAREAAMLADKANKHAARDCYSSYFKFRTKINEFQSLVALVETRLDRIGDEQVEELYIKFRQLDTVVVIMVVRTSSKFFTMMHDVDALPLGARELLQPELRRLTDIRERMKDQSDEVERMSPGIVETVEQCLEKIERLLERSHQLPEW